MSQNLKVEQPAFKGYIGLARKDITPPTGIYCRCWGAAEHDTATGVHRPLTVTTISFRKTTDSEPFFLVGVDLIGINPEIEIAVREKLSERFHLKPEQLLINAGHPHATPPLCMGLEDKPGGELIAPYIEKVTDAITESCLDALENQELSVLSWKYGKCSLAANRDLPDPGKRERYLCGFNPSVQADDTLLVGRIARPDGKVRGIIVNYACHPVTLAWENSLVSPDYIGAMRELVEATVPDSFCLFLQGASGELNPREDFVGKTEIADKQGRELGYAVLSTIEGMFPPESGLVFDRAVESGAPLANWKRVAVAVSGELKGITRQAPIQFKALLSIEEIDEEIKQCRDRALLERLDRKRKKIIELSKIPQNEMPVYAWRLGSSFLLAQGGEAYSGLQTELRKSFPETSVAVLNLTNMGSFGYLPPAELYGEDLYQVWQSPLERGCLELMIEAGQEALRELEA